MTTLTINGKYLRELRRSKNWSQQQLADKIFFSRRRIIALEQGCITPMTTIKSLANALETDFNNLIQIS